MDAEVTFKYLPPRSTGTIMMLLSVNLILLSFFIMLNALATKSVDKTRQAALSLQSESLAAPVADVPAEEDVNRALRLWQTSKQALLEELTRNLIAPGEVMVRTTDANVEALLPLAIFFTDDSAQMKESGQALLENFMASMAGQGYVQVMVRMPPAATALAAQRAQHLYGVLGAITADGSPDATVGFDEGDARLVLLLTPPASLRQKPPETIRER